MTSTHRYDRPVPLVSQTLEVDAGAAAVLGIVADFEAEYGITVTIPDVNAADDVLNKIIA